MRYLPFLNGKYSVAPGLQQSDKAAIPADRQVFQVDDQYMAWLGNKRRCRQEDIYKYYHESALPRETASAINRYLANQLAAEHPSVFRFEQQAGSFSFSNLLTGESFSWGDDWIALPHDTYVNLFDALACQVQEDVLICQLHQDNDHMAAIHLCAPNHWEPGDKIGKRFSYIHHAVPGMEKLNASYFSILNAAVHKGPFTRFAWGLSTDTYLNHHPVAPPGADAIGWQGRAFGPGVNEIYVRTERQNLVGFPGREAFLFTIRTYFYPVSTLSREERAALMRAIGDMSPASLAYKGLAGSLPWLRTHLLPTTANA
ncbi:heme-dependent oxidative N-demethylase subunit alpha family protein [Hufsiella ginkgonis]|uniref:DUF3445 domain-containing protein n=1 Tax=Hufsiella ginkgonis TaxID=2695274 RepID=A0A7K1XZ79_9SPHI|nr:heme-dependent oxidative N-demethylase subunit alpha family protein [Hufsiella ginkgonis]MXV16263.1 DUF3445 domain-containing protein [Hufsiella ginkgonis]